MAINNPTGQNGAGGANGGSQYSPFNVSATGGAGQSGKMDMQAATYVPGLPYGQGKATYDSQVQAPMAGNPYPELPTPVSLEAPSMAPDEPGTAGINRGPGGGSELLMDMPRAMTPSVLDTINKLVMFDDTGEAEFIAQKFSGF